MGELVQFLSVGKKLGVNGLLDDIVHNDANITKGDVISEEHSNEKLETSFEQTDGTPRDIVKEKCKRLNINGSQQENTGFSCNKCEAVYRSRRGLIHHKKSVHDRVTYECNHCDYRVTQQGHLTTHIKSVHNGLKYNCNICEY